MGILVAPLILSFAAVLPVILLAALRLGGDLKYAGLAAAFVLIHETVSRFPSSLGIHFGHWNWAGKALGILISLIWIATSGLRIQEFGVSVPSRYGWIFSASLVLIGGGLCLLTTVRHSAGPLNVETLLFQMFIPSIDEELAFRGILYTSLLRSLREGRLGACAPLLAVILVSLLFSLAHGLVWGKDRLYLELTPVFESLVPGVLMTLARSVTGSLLPSMLIHSVDNVLTYLLRIDWR